MRNLERVVRIHRQFMRLASSSTIAATTTAASSKPTPSSTTTANKKLKKKDDWKTELLTILEAEHKQKKRITWKQRASQNALADIIRFTLKDDVQSLVRLTENQLRSRFSPEIVPLCFLVLNKKFERILKKQDLIDSRASLSLFLGVADLFRSLKRNESNTSYLMALLLQNSVRRWKDQRGFEKKKSNYIAELFNLMQGKMGQLVGSVNTNEQQLELFLTAEEHKIIQKEVDLLRKFYYPPPRKSEKMRYSEDLSLVEPLQMNCPREEYRDNPFQATELDKTTLKKLFEEHLETEGKMWIQVKNTVGDTVESKVSGENLIEEWNWRKRIGDGLRKLDPEQTHPLVAAFLELLPREKLIETLYFSAMAACSQGQNLIGATQFQFDVIEPILKELGNAFKKEIGLEENEIWKRVYDQYIQYFLDPEVSRQNTHREWWQKSCKTQNISANFQFQMGNMDVETREAVCNVIINVLFDSCLFPLEGKNGKLTWQRAFSFRAISIEEESKVSTDGRLSLSRMLSINPKLISKFEAHPFEFIVFSTENLPMTVPPRPWIDKGTGGPLYKTSQEIIRKMLEFKAVRLNDEMRQRITSPSQARPVFDALNQLGSTPWVINEPMLDTLKEVFEKSKDSASEPLLEKLGIPMRHDTFDIPDFVREFGKVKREDVDVERFREYAKKKAEAVKARNESNSLWCWMQYRVVLADHFRGRTLFFPHNMDFRGRVYPLSPYLSHMGDDVNRCILKFAKSQPLGDKGYDWLKLHCINLTGTMKRASVADRMLEAERLLPLILDSARNPLGGEKWWMSSDEPWQTLAACVEIEQATHYGSDIPLFPSQLPVHQDGSCNGLQHYAALGRDNEGGVQVNLTRCETPNDVYSDVAMRVEQKRKQDEESTTSEDHDVALKLRQSLPQNVPRKVIKQTVMTTVYGVTMYGAVLQIKRQLKALDIPGEDAALFARYLARKTFASLNDAFTSSMALKDWFRLIAKGASDLTKTVEWITPLGLPVVQPYCRLVERRSKLVLVPIPMKQVDAFPPNFVHSLDSTHMMLTSLNCANRGITFAAVHDCFWTHANSVDEMNEICRQQFVSLHSQPIVEQCSEWFKKTYLTPKIQKILPQKEFEKFEDIFTAKVEQGELDIEKVKESVYFFS
ncbi:unnamed protein product [Caenorhabditis brenneri]